MLNLLAVATNHDDCFLQWAQLQFINDSRNDGFAAQRQEKFLSTHPQGTAGGEHNGANHDGIFSGRRIGISRRRMPVA